MASESDKQIEFKMEVTELLQALFAMGWPSRPASDFVDLRIPENQADYFKKLFRGGMLESN